MTPPPSSGSIVIRKQVEGSDAAETFGYTGNVSYNPSGTFDLSASAGDPDSIEFVRGETGAGDEPWTVVEDAHEGWRLTGLSCTSPSGSTTATNMAARSVQIRLVAGDTVTCTFTNRLTRRAGRPCCARSRAAARAASRSASATTMAKSSPVAS